MAGIVGKKLTGGDPTEFFVVEQAGMEQYAADWRKIVAQVTDSTGKTWYSKQLGPNERPSWAAKRA